MKPFKKLNLISYLLVIAAAIIFIISLFTKACDDVEMHVNGHGAAYIAAIVAMTFWNAFSESGLLLDTIVCIIATVGNFLIILSPFIYKIFMRRAFTFFLLFSLSFLASVYCFFEFKKLMAGFYLWALSFFIEMLAFGIIIYQKGQKPVALEKHT